MDYLDDAKRLLSALAEELDNPGLALDASGTAVQEIDGTEFTFTYDSPRRCLFIHAPAGDLHRTENPGAVLEQMLHADHLWQGTAGGVLGLDEERNELVFSYRLDFPLPGEDVPDTLLCDLLPHLAGVIEWCRDLIAPEEA